MPTTEKTAAAGEDTAAAAAGEDAPAFTEDQVSATMGELVALDVALREHGSSVAQVLRKAAHNAFGIVA